MTAAVTQAVNNLIAELERHRGDVTIALFGLRNLIGHHVDSSDQRITLPSANETKAPSAETKPAVVETKPARTETPKAQRETVTRHAPTTPTAPVEPTNAATNKARILAEMRSEARHMKAREVAALFPDLTYIAVKSALKQLREAGLVSVAGRANQAHWVAKPRASDSTPPQFETVWAGRKGDPSLIGDQSRKAS
jgi:hypothetical protein